MERLRGIVPVTGILFVLGLSGLFRFSQDVSSLDVVGLSGSGFALGVGFAFLILGLSGRIKPQSPSGSQ